MSQTTTPTSRLGLVKFGPEVIAKKRSLLEETRMLQGMVTDEQNFRKVIEAELAKLKD